MLFAKSEDYDKIIGLNIERYYHAIKTFQPNGARCES